jgi:hypothetical protein
MIKITHIDILDKYKLHIVFDDGVEKIIDGRQFIGDDPFTQPLSDPEYFRKVKIYDNGRGLYWPNDYDICPDNLRYYIEALETHESKSSHQSSRVA